MPSLIKIPYSTVEYQARFARPVIQLIAEKAAPIQAVVDALIPFGFQFVNTETDGMLSAHKTTFRLPDRNIVFHFGAEECRFTKNASNWNTADEDLQVLIAAESAVLAQGAEVRTRSVAVAMHLQLVETPRSEILSRFAPEPFFKNVPAEYQPIQFGTAVTLAHGSILVDHSATVANGIFVRFAQEFDAIPSLLDIMAKVRRDEEFLFGVLDVEEELSHE
jgi:hypothetical protein